MTIAFWCVLISILLPSVWVGYAKSSGWKDKSYDNHAPRVFVDTVEGAYQRASWAEKNSYESLPGFVGAVIIAHWAGAEQGVIDLLAVIYIASRVLYGICYIKDWASLRSAVWGIGVLSIIGMFVAAA